MRHIVWILVVILLMTAPAVSQTVSVDVDWYGRTLIETIDDWNTAAGAYDDDFNGFFNVNMERDWQPGAVDVISAVAQSRGIYINVEAYRAAQMRDEDGQRFLDTVNAGVNFLLDYMRDDVYGGYIWQVNADGSIADPQKQDYGNVHSILALAHAFAITENPDYLEAALDQVDVVEAYFFDPDYPGGLLPSQSRDFSQIYGNNNLDAFLHFFEALLALHDVTEGETQVRIDDLIIRQAEFLLNTLYNDQEGFDDRGYVAFNYADDWTPSQIPYERRIQWGGAAHATPGHGIEFAWLISRAIERGFNPEWLDTADKLMRFAVEYGLVNGGMLYDITNYDGTPIEGNPDNEVYLWWPQGETARAALHFVVVRDRDDLIPVFEAAEDFILNYLTDPEYGGWYRTVSTGLEPVEMFKGNIWKVMYHYTMFHAEVLRLSGGLTAET